MSYDKEREALLKHAKATYLGKGEFDWDALTKTTFDKQTFITLYSFPDDPGTVGKYKNLHKVKELLGYSDDEFIVKNLYNEGDSLSYITYEADVEHLKRYDEAIFLLIAQEYKLEILGDYYELIFRIYKKGNKKNPDNILWVRRICYILSPHTFAHLDIWKIIPTPPINCVVAKIYSEKQDNAAEIFYDKNRELLSMQPLNPYQKQVITLHIEGNTASDIAKALNKTDKQIERCIERARSKIFDFFRKVNINVEDRMYIRDIEKKLRSYGLYPFY